MHAPLLSPLQKSLLDGWQRGFPLTSHPFAAIAETLGVGEDAVIEASADMIARGMVSRLGLVVRPNTAGASTLAALACAPHEIDAMAARISAEPGVNHNYEREHPELPIWFVATGATREHVDATLSRIAERTGREVLDLPLLREYRIDLGFPLEGPCRPHDHTPAKRPADEQEKRVLAALADGFAATPRYGSASARTRFWRRSRERSRRGSSSGSAGSCVIARSVSRPMRCACSTSPIRRSTRSPRVFSRRKR